MAPAAQSPQERFARSHWLCAELVVARPPRNDRYGCGCRLCSRCCNVVRDLGWAERYSTSVLTFDKARNVQTLPERRHQCSAPASDELRKNPIIGTVSCGACAVSAARSENTAKFTPPEDNVAPSGYGEPGRLRCRVTRLRTTVSSASSDGGWLMQFGRELPWNRRLSEGFAMA